MPASPERPLAAGENIRDNPVNPVRNKISKNRIHSTSLQLFEVSQVHVVIARPENQQNRL
jgi:hypothetical protein